MKTRKNLLLFFGVVIILGACSKDSDSDKIDSQDLIIGEWLFISESDYKCGTHEVVSDRTRATNEEETIIVYEKDGSWYYLVDGKRATDGYRHGGTWTNKGNNIYDHYYINSDDFQSVMIDFVGENIMRDGIDDKCVEIADKNIYTYVVWHRR